MRPVVAVDLATRFSAGIAMDSSGEIISQWDSFKWSHSRVAQRILADYLAAVAHELGHEPIVVIEDLPPHVPSSTITKSVAQLQGRILHEFAVSVAGKYGVLGNVYFVPPAYWQRDMGVWMASTEVAEAVAAELGYVPPDLAAARGYERGQRGWSTLVREADKQRTDYVSAFLIATWARRCMAENRTWDMSIVKQYES